MVKVRFVASPTKVELVGCSSVSGSFSDFERVQASIYLSSIEPSISFKAFYRRLSQTRVEQVTDYVVEEDLNFLKHTWLSFMTNCSRIATIDEESEHHSYTEKSQRYTLMKPESHVPDGTEGVLRDNILKPAVQHSFDLYYRLKEQGIMLEDARDILSMSAMTSVVSTRSTYDELFHIASCTRGSKTKEICEIGRKQYRILRSIAPNIFDEEGDILRKFHPRKSFVSLDYKNSRIEEILLDLKEDSHKPFASVGKIDFLVSPKKTGFIPALAARTTRVLGDFVALKKDYEEGKINDAELERTLRNVMESGHTSVAEHDYYLLKSSITNSLAHQLVRHRHIWDTYTPLIEAGKNFRVLVPRSIKKSGLERNFLKAAKTLKEAFDKLMDAGIKEAFYVLPNATLIDTYVTTNAAELLHVIRRRTCKLAQEPIRLRFAMPLWKKLTANNSSVFSSSGPDCITNECHEKWPCKNPYLPHRIAEVQNKKTL
jgi:thymidylate synthase ThyX